MIFASLSMERSPDTPWRPMTHPELCARGERGARLAGLLWAVSCVLCIAFAAAAPRVDARPDAHVVVLKERLVAVSITMLRRGAVGGCSCIGEQIRGVEHLVNVRPTLGKSAGAVIGTFEFSSEVV